VEYTHFPNACFVDVNVYYKYKFIAGKYHTVGTLQSGIIFPWVF